MRRLPPRHRGHSGGLGCRTGRRDADRAPPVAGPREGRVASPLLSATSAATRAALLLLHLQPASAAPGAAGADTGPPAALRFAVVGDYGNDSPDEAAVAALIRGWKPDFIITTGDNNYPGGTTATI